jgi:hypothetical protein
MTDLLQFRDERAPWHSGHGRAFERPMLGIVVLVSLQAAAVRPPAQPASQSSNPRAIELFDRDWVLNQWAKRQFDANGDGLISVEEAQPAARAFKEIADGDRDGRVTPYEYERAREFILARY